MLNFSEIKIRFFLDYILITYKNTSKFLEVLLLNSCKSDIEYIGVGI